MTFNGCVIEDEPLRVERFVLDYHEHSGFGEADALAADWPATEKRYGIIDSDRGRPTADGDTPQQKAIRILTGKNGQLRTGASVPTTNSRRSRPRTARRTA